MYATVIIVLLSVHASAPAADSGAGLVDQRTGLRVPLLHAAPEGVGVLGVHGIALREHPLELFECMGYHFLACDDDKVSTDSSDALAKRLKELQTPLMYWRVKGGGHGAFHRASPWGTWMEKLAP